MILTTGIVIVVLCFASYVLGYGNGYDKAESIYEADQRERLRAELEDGVGHLGMCDPQFNGGKLCPGCIQVEARMSKNN